MSLYHRNPREEALASKILKQQQQHTKRSAYQAKVSNMSLVDESVNYLLRDLLAAKVSPIC